MYVPPFVATLLPLCAHNHYLLPPLSPLVGLGLALGMALSQVVEEEEEEERAPARKERAAAGHALELLLVGQPRGRRGGSSRANLVIYLLSDSEGGVNIGRQQTETDCSCKNSFYIQKRLHYDAGWCRGRFRQRRCGQCRWALEPGAHLPGDHWLLHQCSTEGSVEF